jgi:hypothetical protein
MKTKLSWFDRMMIAVTYAEHDAMDSVKEITATQDSRQEKTCKETLLVENGEKEKSTLKTPKISPIARLTNIIKSFEDTMASTAFAEAGEQAAAYRMYHQGRNARKKVLLGTDTQELDLHTIGYALKLCQRVEAGLEIFHVVTNEKTDQSVSKGTDAFASPRQLQTLLGELGIEYNPVESKASFQKELVDHVSTRKNIMCVVVGSPKQHQEKTDHKKRLASMAKAFSKLNCPLVVYEQPAHAL